jgi:hypothetical protein
MMAAAAEGRDQRSSPSQREFRLRTGALFAGLVLWPLFWLCGLVGVYFCVDAVMDGSFGDFPVIGQAKFIAFGAASVFLVIVGPLVVLELLVLWWAGVFGGYRIVLNTDDGTVDARGDGSAPVSVRNPGRSLRRGENDALDAKRPLILRNRRPDPAPRLLARLQARVFWLVIFYRERRRPPDDALFVPVHVMRDGTAFIRAIEGLRRL